MPSSKTNLTLANSMGGTRRNLRKRSSPSSQNMLKPIVPSTFADRNSGDNSSFDAVLAAAATATTTTTTSFTSTAPSNVSLTSFYSTQHEQTLQGQTINSILQGTTITNETPKRFKIASNSNATTNANNTSNPSKAATNAKALKSSISKTSSPLQMMLEVEENRKMLKSLPDIQPNHLHQHHNYYHNQQQHNHHSSPLSQLQQHNQQQQLSYPQQSLVPHSSSSAYTTHSQIESCESPYEVFAFKENIPPNNRRLSAVGQRIACAGTGTASTTKNYDKGLRHFSARVCAKVEEKGSTTYNEVADELVKEIALEKMATPSQGVGGMVSTSSAASSGAIKCTTSSDHKNIRRRVYDALNVLMAIDVIVKDKKEIRWLGIPDLSDRYFDDNVCIGGGGGFTYNNGGNSVCSSDPLERIILTNKTISDRLMEKKRNLMELTQRTIALQNLIKRNSKVIDTDHMLRLSESSSGSSATAENNRTPLSSPLNDRLALPFILINAPKNCRVHCEMLEDQSQYFFEFDSPFLINEDIELLRLMDNGHLLKGCFDEEQDGLEEDTFGGLFKSNNNKSMICKDHLRLPVLPSSIISFYQKMNNTNLKGKNLTLNLIRSLSPSSIAACNGGTSSSSTAAFFDSKQQNPLS